MFWGSFDVPIGVIILVLLVVFWKPVTSRILLWVFVIITFPFVALWKGIEKLAGIDENSCETSDEDARELALKRRWLMKRLSSQRLVFGTVRGHYLDTSAIRHPRLESGRLAITPCLHFNCHYRNQNKVL